MDFAEFIPFVGCIVNVLLAIFVLSQDFRRNVNRVYFLCGIVIAGWNFGMFQLFLVSDHASALFWVRFIHFWLVFGPPLLVHLSLLIAGIPVSRWIQLFYGVQVAISLTVFTPLFIRDVRPLGEVCYYAVPGPVYYPFSAMFGFYFISVIILMRKRRELPALYRTRMDPLIVAQTLLVVLGTNDILPILGIDKYPLTNFYVYPFGSIAAVFYGIMVGYSVLQHQLLDIHISLSRIAAQLVRFAFVLFIGLLLLLVATLIAPGQFNPFSFSASLIVLILSSTIASLLFPRMFGSGLETLERRILGDRFEYHDRIRTFIDSLHYYSEIDPLLTDLGELLSRALRVTNYSVILRDETNRSFTIVRSYPPSPPEEVRNLRSNSAVFQFFELSKSEYLPLFKGSSGTRHIALAEAARKDLVEFCSEFCFPFFFHEEPFGLLLLGPKQSEAHYTANDMSLLTLLAQRLSLVINQLRLQAQIFHQQELELLGRMSRGMAHDLNNLLTPVSTFFQLSSEGVPMEILNEDLLPVATRNVATLRAYIREALFFSENLRPDFQLGRLDIVLTNAADLALNSRANRDVTVARETSKEVLVEMDEVLIQRMLSNIVANAIDASEQGGTVRTELRRLPRSEADRDWLRVSIIDAGQGIAKQDLERVFKPYYTTKNRGDESRGFGLGLAICRKIVNLHGGTLNIASQPGQGTTVQIDLPSRQLPAPAPSVQRTQ